MKLAIVLFAVLGLSFGAVLPHGGQQPLVHQHDTRNLGDILQELLNLIPLNKVLEIFEEHMQNDPQVQNAVKYLQSDDFKKIVTTVQAMPEFDDFVKFLYDSGLDIYTYLNFINDMLGLPHINPPVRQRLVAPKTIMSMVFEILSILPIEDIKNFYHEKVENDPDFINLLARMRSPEFKKIVDTLRAMPEYQDLLNGLRENGVPVDEILQAINGFFGWGQKLHSARNLGDLFDQLMDLIPKDKILEIILDHVQNDPEVQEAIAYMKSDDFKTIITTVQSLPAFSEFVQYLYDSGLDIYTYVNDFNNMFGLPTIKPPTVWMSYRPRSLMDMVNEILAVLPLDEIKQFYHDNLENNPDFINLINRIKSPEFKTIIDALHSLPEYQDMLEKLKSHGIPVEEIKKAIDNFFGWGTRSLRLASHLDDLFKQFLSLIPLEKVGAIIANHVSTDPEVQEAVAFLESPEFAKIVEAVDNNPAYRDLLDYIYKAGIDIYTYVNLFHNILGIPPYIPAAMHHQTRTILGMIDEILAVLPLQDMLDFYNNTLKNDPDFQALLAKLMSPEFAQLVADVKAMPEYQDMLDRLKSHGIDVEAIQKEIDDFFHWGTRSLRLGTHLDDLFKEFVALIPADKIIGIIANHIQNDPEVQEAVAFLKSPEFAKIVEAVDNNPAYRDLLDYIYKAGVDIYAYVNLLHNIFGIPPITPPVLRRQSRTILGMIDEILAVLPLQEMEDFYNNKLMNDPDFQALLAKLMSPEFVQLVADVKAMPEYQDMLARLKSHGIDVEAIQKKIDDFFHWGTRSLRLGTHLDDLFKEFVALIPADKIIGIIANHIQNDPEVQEAVAFLKSPDFAKIVEAVDNNPAYRDLLDYIYKAGVDIYSYVNLLHNIFGIPPITPPVLRRQSRTILGMIDEILAVLPLQEMKDFYNNKLMNDPDFQALLAKLMSPEFAQLVAEVKAMPEYQDMLARLKSHGIDVEAIQKEIDDFFHWGTRSLRLGTHLDDLFKEFVALIPADKIIGIIANHIQNDPEVQEAVAFLKSPDFAKIVEAVDNNPAYRDLLDYIYKAGVDIYSYVNLLHNIFGIPPITPPVLRRQSRTILGMIDEILAVLPLQEMKDFYNNKLMNDPDFQALLAKLMSPEFAQLVAEVKAMPEYQDMLARLKSHGIDVEAIQKEIDDFFHWGTRSLRLGTHLDDLFKEFVALIPADKIIGIIANHIQNDPEVQEAVAFLKSPDFAKIVMAVDNSPAFMDLVDYIYKAGIDIYSYINLVHDILGLPHINPPLFRRQSRTLLGMIDEILAVLPLQEMQDFYNNKLKNDPDFIALLAKLSSPEFAQLVADVKAMPEYQDMLDRLKSHGIDVAAIQKEIDDFFGWGFRNVRLGSHLDDLFKEFVSLIPIDKIAGIVANHLQNDPEVQEAFAFLKSPEFAKIVEAVDNSAAFKDLVDYIYKAGVDIYSYINLVHDILGLPHINPPTSRRQARTLLGMIDEILAVLPLQEMLDFYNNKVKNDPDFIALLAKLKAPEFAQLVAQVKAMPEYQDMLDRLKAHGVDVAAIQKEIDDFFGWGSRSLRLGSHLDDLFKEFVSLIPIDKIAGIVANHLQNDPEVQEAFAFLKSPEFAKIIMAVDDSAAFKDLVDYIYKAGVDIYSYINLVHDILGLPHINPPTSRRQARTLLGMIDEILAVLPLQEMLDFYNNKVKNDPDFIALLAKLKAPEFAQLVAQVKAMPEYQDMLDRLKAHGVDVAAIQKEIDDFFGWGSRSLRLGSHLDDLFKEFVSLIPIDKIAGIVANHLQNDPEVQEAFAFLKSPEFAKIIMAVDDSAAFKDLVDYIYKAGVDIYSYINLVHDILGLPHINPPTSRRQSRTLLGMIDEILAVLPLQEMLDFYNNKVKNDPDFIALLAKLKAPEFAQLVAQVKAMPEYQDMLDRLKAHGVDVAAIQKEIDDFFGWGSRSLRLGSHLDDLFKEFVSLIPIDKIAGIVANHLQNDPEVQEAFAFLKSPEFAKIIMAVDDSAAFKDLVDYIYKAGVDIYSYINLVHDILGLPHINPPTSRRQSRTLLGMIDEILAVLPLQEMLDFYNNKVKNDPDFIALLAKLKAPEFAQLVAQVKAMPEYQDMLDRLKAHGVDVAAIQKEIDDFFGWGSRSLRLGSHLDDLFKEFVSLIPIDKIAGIVANHLQNDPEVQEAFAFLKSPEFAKIVEAVDNSAAFKDLVDYIYKAGVDIYSYINLVHDILGLPHINPPTSRRQSRTLLGMIDEILAVLPLQEMLDFYNNKVKNDPDFIALLAKLKAPEFAQLVAQVKAMPEYQDMLDRLKAHGVDVAAIQKEIDDFFGWGSRSLRLGSHLDDLFKEFVSLIPIDKIAGIVANHLQNDPEVQEAFAFLKSPEFAKIVEAIDSSPAFTDLVDYIYKAGVDIYAYINLVHDILGLPHIKPPLSRRQSRTLLGMIDEILAVLPLQDMLDFYNSKLKDDPDFQALLAKLRAPEFAQLVAQVKAMPEYQDMLDRLKAHGVDVAAIQKEIDDFFGWGL
ncbi:uncharacterized protein LOC124168644 isoform X4 [Ischnura elegans]|uniref:uncharacterized protein LOC124168644 isoform X4 n=1 Tax=Ischnura elegans TaxID=197161 RepID=UPI001ED88118|nr:uncharacterized protein LOC124168644 isoform X4 [Ischnura elegans]